MKRQSVAAHGLLVGALKQWVNPSTAAAYVKVLAAMLPITSPLIEAAAWLTFLSGRWWLGKRGWTKHQSLGTIPKECGRGS